MQKQTADNHASEAARRALRTGHYSMAITFYRQAMLQSPGQFAPVRGVAVAQLRGGDEAAARAVLSEFLLDHPLCAAAWQMAGQVDWKRQRHADAIQTLQRGLTFLPNAAALHRQLAIFLGAKGRLEEALRHVAEAVRDEHLAANQSIEQIFSAALGENRRPAALLDSPPSQRQDTIEDHFDPLITSPALLEAILHGLPAGELDDSDRQMLVDLESRLTRLLVLQPHHADRQVTVAKVQMRLGMTVAAMLSLQRALNSNPKLPAAHRLRAELLCTLGETDQAIEALRQLVRKGQGWADIHVEIARLEQQRGRADDARVHLQSALRINPQYTNAKSMLEAMPLAA